MAAANYTNDVLTMFYGEISEEKNMNLPQPMLVYADFKKARTDFKGWLHVWKMNNPEKENDFLTFANRNENKFVNVVKKKMEQLGSVKVENAVKVKFEKVKQDENGNERVTKMEHFFKGEIKVFQNASEKEIKDEFRNFAARVMGEIENWSEAGSGWGYVGTDTAYVNVARYDPLVAGTYIPLPAKLQSKKSNNKCAKQKR